MFLRQFVLLLGLLITVSAEEVTVEEQPHGLDDGGTVRSFTLTHANGLRVEVIDYGATLIGVYVPDREGKVENVTLHLEKPTDYLGRHPLFGSIVGRFANRIDGGGFSIDGKRFDLETVNAKTKVHIHGGKTGFQKQVWEAGEIEDGVRFTLTSPDGHEGFPGTLTAVVTYRLSADSLQMSYEATTDHPTHVNLTNHAYWNLGGAASGPVLKHRLQLEADAILAIDSRKIPTGEFQPVMDSPFDFRKSQSIVERIAEVDGGGYDHCYVLRADQSESLRRAARVEDPESGRVMEVFTTAPGLQLYTANGMKRQSGDLSYGSHDALCLECQHFPDSPNQPAFPSTLLRPGETYRQTTLHRFSLLPES